MITRSPVLLTDGIRLQPAAIVVAIGTGFIAINVRFLFDHRALPATSRPSSTQRRSRAESGMRRTSATRR